MAGEEWQGKTHPVVQCFIDSLEQEQRGEEGGTKVSAKNGLRKVCQSVAWRNRYGQSEHYPVALRLVPPGPSGRPTMVHYEVKQVQRGEVEHTYGTGATVWPASLVLIKYLERRYDCCTGKRVVDLGAGTGVVSIAAAFLRASFVLCTDGCPNVVRLATHNVQQTCSSSPNNNINPVGSSSSSFWLNPCEIRVQQYSWGDGTLKNHYEFDVILVSDCVLPKLYPLEPLVDAIDELSGSDTVTYLAYETRYFADYDPVHKFRSLAADKGLTVRVIPMEEHHSVYSVQDIQIWNIQRRTKNHGWMDDDGL